MKKNLRGMKMDPALMARMAGPEGQQAMADMESVMARYQGKSQNELMEELKRMIAAERAAGRLDDARMREVTGMMGTMLSPAERERMEQVLSQL